MASLAFNRTNPYPSSSQQHPNSQHNHNLSVPSFCGPLYPQHPIRPLHPNSPFRKHPLRLFHPNPFKLTPPTYFHLFPQLDSLQNLIFFAPAFLKAMNFRNLEDFWAFYVNQHSKPSTRRWHFAGTLFSIFFLLCSFFFSWWFLFFVPFSGYGCAWYSHFFVEGNVPATFGHPFWSLLCDFKMFGLMLTGKMDREIKRLGKRPVLQVF
ncbi:unnamed protein product [Sphenostylis stenocarpa]|uniref:Uncharacterized protein n=1 Tax=Sphenostylis stenocarpa TaxID=92480 RepID=A0AA86V157_9FABA|nr:unnamed protein product [Sphenostylis stenocarpa]